MNKAKQTIIVKETFPQPVQTVWRAITEVAQMRQWFFLNIPAFQAEPGFETQFSVQSESREFVHLWKIEEVEAEKRIVYNWKYEGYPGNSFVTFELSEEAGCTQIVLTHEGMESFLQDIPEFKPESCKQGWKYFIQERLKNYLESK